jgi:hypothetical protein
MAKDVFISHSSIDRTTASVVCAFLESQGLNCWIAPRDIQPGQSWGESIVNALDECPIMVLILTPQANASHHVDKEVERADNKGARIITFRVAEVTLKGSLEYFLSAEHWLDAVNSPIETHLPRLIEAIHRLRNLGRRSTNLPTLSNSPEPRLPAINDRELVNTFDELAPDDWNGAPRGTISRFIQSLFDDR